MRHNTEQKARTEQYTPPLPVSITMRPLAAPPPSL